MIPYNPEKALISIHIPKCAGQSLTPVLRQWYGDRFYTHYNPPGGPPPKKRELRPGICIHGHFHMNAGIGIPHYYPEADQFITFLRDPVEIHVSNYFFWKTKARPKQVNAGIIQEGGPHDYRNIDDFFRMRPLSHIYKYMPEPVTEENYQDILVNKFVWIGFVSKMRESISRLASRLGFEPSPVPHINPSPRDEKISDRALQKFMDNNKLAFHIYRKAWELYGMEE
jgi:hypothetical protein